MAPTLLAYGCLMSGPIWPDPDVAADLYARLTAGDPVASSDLAVAFIDPLVGYLRAKCPAVDDHSLFTAAGDAVWSLIRTPTQFDPARAELAGYLRMAAHKDLLNVLARERRHQVHRVGQDYVELTDVDGNESREDEDLPSFDDPDLAAVVASLTHAERRMFDYMRAGEKRTPVLAEGLGFADRPVLEQRREIKRMRDRIIRRLQRAKGGT